MVTIYRYLTRTHKTPTCARPQRIYFISDSRNSILVYMVAKIKIR